MANLNLNDAFLNAQTIDIGADVSPLVKVANSDPFRDRLVVFPFIVPSPARPAATAGTTAALLEAATAAAASPRKTAPASCTPAPADAPAPTAAPAPAIEKENAELPVPSATKPVAQNKRKAVKDSPSELFSPAPKKRSKAADMTPPGTDAATSRKNLAEDSATDHAAEDTAAPAAGQAVQPLDDEVLANPELAFKSRRVLIAPSPLGEPAQPPLQRKLSAEERHAKEFFANYV